MIKEINKIISSSRNTFYNIVFDKVENFSDELVCSLFFRNVFFDENKQWVDSQKSFEIVSKLKKIGYNFFKIVDVTDNKIIDGIEKTFSVTDWNNLPGQWKSYSDIEKIMTYLNRNPSSKNKDICLISRKDAHLKKCLIAVCKDEADFLQEWIDYHLNLGFDKIFLMDNNSYENRIQIENPNVYVFPVYEINFSGEKWWNIQVKLYNTILNYIRMMSYDYGCILDIDEFLVLKTGETLDEFIFHRMFLENVDAVEFWWENFDDNDIIYEKDTLTSVRETYTRKVDINQLIYNHKPQVSSKTIFRIAPDIEMESGHYIKINDGCSNNLKKIINYNKNIGVINHYRTKCLETYLKHKVLNANCRDNSFFNSIVNAYFSYNRYSPEKIQAFKELGEKYGIEFKSGEFDNFE